MLVSFLYYLCIRIRYSPVEMSTICFPSSAGEMSGIYPYKKIHEHACKNYFYPLPLISYFSSYSSAHISNLHTLERSTSSSSVCAGVVRPSTALSLHPHVHTEVSVGSLRSFCTMTALWRPPGINYSAHE